MPTIKGILDAWAEIRRTNNTIPDGVLDFMKDAAIEKLGVNPVVEKYENALRLIMAERPQDGEPKQNYQYNRCYHLAYNALKTK